MKAAVLHAYGQTPVYEEIATPIPASEREVLMTVKAAALKNLDKGRASGGHYSGYAQFPAVVGVDGTGVLEDGTVVYAMGVTGMMAAQAVVDRRRCVVLPAGMDFATAAALPNAVLGAALALTYRAGMQPGKTVLINGATGFTGKVAVQLARSYGAARVIATGRNPQILEQLRGLGADEIVSLAQDDAALVAQLKTLHAESHIDIVLDYTWGRPIELIIAAVKGEGLAALLHSVRIVTVGEMAGMNIQLASGTLRSSPIEILGSGFGSLSDQALSDFRLQILPSLLQDCQDGKLKVDIRRVPLSEVNTIWHQEPEAGSRWVFEM